MRMSSFLIAVLAVNLQLAVPAHAQRLGVAPDSIEPVGEIATPNDLSQFTENDALERFDQQKERFDGPLSESAKQAMLSSFLQQKLLYGAQFAGGQYPRGVPVWKSLGPTSAKYQTNGVTLKISDSGRVRTILQSPADPDTVYVLSSGGGLWKTTTFSQTNPRWDPKTDALLSTSGGSVAFGRSANVLYLGLGDPFDGLPKLGGVVTRSVDGGDTWQAFATLSGATYITDIKVDTAGPADVILVGTDVGLFRSVDNGASFSLVAAIPNQTIWSIVKTSAGWLASSWWFNNPTGRILVSGDNGASWSLAGAGFTNAGRATLAVANPGEAIVYAYAGATDGSAQKDLYRSNDGGLTFTPLNITSKTPTNPNYWQGDMNLMGGQAWYNQLILVDPNDRNRNTVYLGGQLATAKTTDGGATWTQLSTWLPYPPVNVTLPYVHADCHFATYLNVKGTRSLTFGTDGGIFVSGDDGATWDFSKNDGIVSFLAQTVASSGKNPQDFIIGLQDTGSRARLGASSFFNQVSGGDGEGVGWSQANNAYTVTTAAGGVIYTSTGLLPNTKFDYLTGHRFGGGFFFTPLATPTAALDPSGQVFFSAISSGVIYTPNGGRNWYYWARIGSRIPAGFAIRGVWNTIGLNVADDGIAVGGTGGRLAVSTDYVNYAVRRLICPSPTCVPGFRGFITAPVWAPNSVLYVVSESPIPGSVRVLRSNDRGATFAAAGAGLPDAPVYHLVADPRDSSGNTAYAGTAIGVYKTSNGGASWTLFGAGMPTVPANALSISADGSLLRVATYGRGAWEIQVP